MANVLIQPKDQFNYVLSCDLAIPLEIKMCNLEGERGVKDVKALIDDPMLQFSGMYQSKHASTSGFNKSRQRGYSLRTDTSLKGSLYRITLERSDLFVECQVFDGGQPISLPSQTSHKAFTTKWSWNEWVTIPILIKDIPRTAQLAMTVYDIYGPGKAVPVGGTTVSLFGKRGGFHDLKVWRDTVADGSADSATPGKLKNEDSEMARLRKLVKRRRHGLMADVDWMDGRVFREIEHVNEKEKRESNHMFLVIEFPHFHVKEEEYRVVHYERVECEVSSVADEVTEKRKKYHSVLHRNKASKLSSTLY